MSLSISFLAGDGTPRQAITLTRHDGFFELPRLQISADRPDTFVEECFITGISGSGLTADLSGAVTEAWQASSVLGSPPLLSAPAWISAAGVTGAPEIRVQWAVRYRDEGFYGGFMNDTEPQLAEASVRLIFEPVAGPGNGQFPPDPQPIPPEENLVPPAEPLHAPDAPLHKGHVAIDFGTSNCTVTLLDQEVLPRHVLSGQQAGELRRRLLTLIDEPQQLGTAVQAELQGCLADVASIVVGADGDSESLRRRLRQLLSNESDSEPSILYATLVELERWVQQGPEELRARLANTLAALYARAWRVPPLDRLRLFPVELGVEGRELESKVSVTPSPWRVRVGTPLGLGGQREEQITFVYAGLKQRLGHVKNFPELGPGVTNDTLLRDSLRDLLRRSNLYIASEPADFGTGYVDNVVITYPTMASPAVRHKLGDMLRELGISRVDLSYDEAIAAAMFFLLRDFGGDHDIGIEVLRSRSRPTSRADQWQQNMLVIDIGGGTADIALLTLTLADTTPSGLDPRLHGRYYEVRPEVRGSTGLLQQGGELMTLRVFSWLKASIADLLHQALPERFAVQRAQLEALEIGDIDDSPLTKWILQNRSSYGRPVHKILDSILPTRSPAEANHPGQTFWVLWSLAERKKFEFCAPDSPPRVTVSALEVRNVLRSVDQTAEAAEPLERAAGLQDDRALELELDAARFEDLVSPELRSIVATAYGLAAKQLEGETPEPLDRVILTGQVSKAPLVRRLVQAQFVGVAKGKDAVSCRPTAIVVEHDYAKLATSVGSCWAASIRGLGRSQEGSREHLRRGHNELFLDVRNLFFHLPCGFRVGTQPGGGGDVDAQELLRMGTELYQLYPHEDVSAVRSHPWQELTDFVNVYRESYESAAGEGMARWGSFQWEAAWPEHARALRDAGWPKQMKYRVEATSSLDLFILLCRGAKPHYLVDGPSIQAVRSDRGRLIRAGKSQPILPGEIQVNAYEPDGSHHGEAAFDPAAEEEATGFPEFFHTASGTEGPDGLRGVIGRKLPDPQHNGKWTFHYKDEKGTLYQIGELAPPPRTGSLRAGYYPTLDERGTLRVHACGVPFWPAESLTDLHGNPGKVRRIPMKYPADQENPAKDPFNGQH